MADKAAPAPSGINIWQVLTGLVTALLVAAVLGLLAMYKNQNDLISKVDALEKTKDEFTAFKKDFEAYKLETTSKLVAIDYIKQGVDRLNKIQDENSRSTNSQAK